MPGPFRAGRRGTIEVVLSAVEANALRRVGEDLLEALGHAGDPQLRRLFPPAYAEEPKLEEEFRALTRDDLNARKASCARSLVAGIDAGTLKRDRWSGTLDADAAQAWLGAINDARLILGTRLDISEDMDPQAIPADHPEAAAYNMYAYLSGLQWYLIDAVSEAEGFGPADQGMA